MSQVNYGIFKPIEGGECLRPSIYLLLRKVREKFAKNKANKFGCFQPIGWHSSTGNEQENI